MKTDNTDTEILKLLAEGLTAKEIAEKLSISKRTVEARILRMKERSSTKTSTHLVSFAYLKGLLTL